MAFSSTKLTESPIAGFRLQVFDLNFASVTEGIVRTGMNQVLAAFYSPDTTDDHGVVQKNKSAASTTENGAVFISGVTSSDLGSLLVIGR